MKRIGRVSNTIFHRSPFIIDRDVKNCHPPESVHMVHRIIEGFRSEQKGTATFWINLKGKVILTQYFALRDTEGKKLLDWE